MSASVQWSGLDELKAALRALPSELRAEAHHVAEASANTATRIVKEVYGRHVVTGHLRDHTDVEELSTGPFGVAWRVKVKSPIAWLFDNGSQARHWASGKSTGAMFSKSPPTHIFARTMAQQRRVMYSKLKATLVRHGLSVTGDA